MALVRSAFSTEGPASGLSYTSIDYKYEPAGHSSRVMETTFKTGKARHLSTMEQTRRPLRGRENTKRGGAP